MSKLVVGSDFAKAHVNAFTRKDGAMVQAHDTKVQAAGPKPGKFHPRTGVAGDYQGGVKHHTEMAARHKQEAELATDPKMKSLHTRGMNLHKKAAQAPGSHEMRDSANQHSESVSNGTAAVPAGPMSAKQYRQQGAVVQGEAAKKPAVPHLGAHANALRASSKPDDMDHEDNQYAADKMEAGDHGSLQAHLGSIDTAARDHILDHVHPEHREKLGYSQIDPARSMKKYAEKFPPAKPKAAAKPAPAAAGPATPEDVKKHAVAAGAKFHTNVSVFSKPEHAHSFAEKTMDSKGGAFVMKHPAHQHHVVVAGGDSQRMEKNGYQYVKPGAADVQKSVLVLDADLLKSCKA